MSATYLMALDAGTGSIRAVIFDIIGNQVSVGQREWNHRIDSRYPGSMNFNWEQNWALVKECIKESMQSAAISLDDIKGLSTTAMREGIVLYDENLKEIWACANVDSRSSQEVNDLILEDEKFEQWTYSKSGQTFALSAIPRLLWVKNNEPKIYNNIRHISMLNDWLIFKLTNQIISEPSNACTTGIFNLEKRDWDTEIIEKIGISADIFPPIKESGEVVGTVSSIAAKETGLSTNTQVVVGGGDAQLGCIGVSITDKNQAAIFGGSFWQYELNLPSPITDENSRVRINCHAIKNLWQAEALAFNPGLVMRWYRDAFCEEEKKIAFEKNVSTYDILNERAAMIPAGSYGLIATFSNVMNFYSWRHASPTFTNFELDAVKFNKYTFYHAIMENTAMVTKGNIDIVNEFTGIRPTEIIFANGASKSDLWCQILADVINCKVMVPKIKEATALGAALLAGYGIGLFEDLSETAKKFMIIDKTYLPDPVNKQVYEKLYVKWQKVYAEQLKIADKELTNYMWIAPGSQLKKEG